MKKTRFLFALLMAVVMMAMSPARAWAEEYPVITGGTHTIDIAALSPWDDISEFSSYTTIFKYVAPNSGTLTVYTEGEGDTYGALSDENKTTLTNDDDSGNSYNFKFSYKVVKDHTYYIGVGSNGEDLTNYTLVIDESDLCVHEIVNHVCTLCGKHQSRIVSVPAGVTVTDDDGNPITSEDYILEGRTVNISVNASEVTAPIYMGVDATTAEGSRLKKSNNSFVMPGSDVTLTYVAIPSEPLCFEAKEDGAKIGFSSIVSDYILYYSTDKENWTSFNYNDTHYLPPLANAGDKIYLIGNVASSAWSYTQVKIEDANVAASGKLSSILGGATIIDDGGCYEMFYYNEKLISAPDMSDITEIGESGCYEMFSGCSALTTAPAMSSLTAIGLAGCFGMFYRCTQLTGFELNTVPYVGESSFVDFGTGNITLKLSADSYVYKEGENPGFPTVTSVTAPCTLNLTGSVVESHANLILNHGTAIDDEEVAATCTEPGHTAGKHCSVCDAALEGLEEISALGHTPVPDEGVDATCTESGLTEGSHCEVCGDVLVAQEEIPASGHNPVTDEGKDATCTESGLTEGSHCSVCDNVLVAQEEIPALGHAYGEEMSLCDDGYHHPVCTREGCDVLSEDKYAKMFGDYKLVKDDENPTATIPMTKVGNKYYASLYTDFPYIFSWTADNNNVCKYTVLSAADGVVTLGNIIDVPANCGVIITKYADESSVAECTIEYAPHIYSYEETDASPLLTGSETDVTSPADNQYAFGLSDTGYLGFWRWPDMTIPAWKAYLDLGSETATEARGFRIVFDDETNGIQQLPADASAIEGCYDLMGRKVREVKGLGIVNGKKVVVNY